MTETLANGYSSERSQRELSNEYQDDRVQMFFKNLCILNVLWRKVNSALEGSIRRVPLEMVVGIYNLLISENIQRSCW